MQSLSFLQELYDRSNNTYWNHRRETDRIYFSKTESKAEAVDALVTRTYRTLLELEQKRRENFSEYYKERKITTYAVECIHVGNVDNTFFSEHELRRLAQSLSFSPLNINHSNDVRLEHLPNRRALVYPSNSTLSMTYDPILQGITGYIQVEDSLANEWISMGLINGLSIEYLNLGGQDGVGMVGTGLALITDGVNAADRNAKIYRPV
jgi:hypothetical protein